GDHLRHDLIAGLDQSFCEFDIAEIGPRRGDRHEYRIDSEFVHQLELPRYAPCRPGVFPAAQHADACKFAFVDIGNDVLVDVNEGHVRWLRHADWRAHVMDLLGCAPLSSAQQLAADMASHERLSANIDRFVDLDQHADAGFGAGVGLLAWQQAGENSFAHGAAVMQFGAAEEPQETALEHAIALCFEVGINHAHASVVRQILQHRALGAFPPCQVPVIEHNHAALRRDVWPLWPARGEQAGIAVVPGIADQGLDGV